ncbi:MAG: hypothetical protein JOZ82_05340, partial [Marmoricola sp.]|nr:hypothetical protein [Marmoricola sp.]
FAFDVEVLARCVAAGHEVVEFPVMWTDVPGSTFVPSRHGASSFAELFAIAVRVRRLSRSAAADVTVIRPAPVEPELTLLAEPLPLVAES